MAEVDKPLMGQAIREWEQASFRQKGAKMREWCRLLGIGRDAFYREAEKWGVMGERKARKDKGERKIPKIQEMVKSLWQIKHRGVPGVRLPSTESALIYGVQQGELPPEIADVPIGTLNRVARELNLMPAAERQTRWQAEYANQVHQMDSSHSEHFIPVRQGPDGDWVLKLRPRRMKNKEKVEHLSVIAYGITDDHSGLRLSRYTVAAGESALGSIDFLKWAWSGEAEHLPFEGWPDELYVDNGPLARHQAFDKFAERLGLKVTAHMPYKSRCTGKVENNWRTLWRKFENVYFLNPAWESFEITLSELNRQKAAFWKRHNALPHRRLPLSREAAWHRSIIARGGVVRIMPDAWDCIFVEAERRVDAAGVLDYQGAPYQVVGEGTSAAPIWNCKVKVFVRLRSDHQRSTGGTPVPLDACATATPTIIVQDLRDGKRYHTVPFELAVWGKLVGSPKCELERLKEEDVAAQLKIPAPPSWTAGGDACATNVHHLPVRQAEVRESGFEMPAQIPTSPPFSKGGEFGGSLEELAAGVRIIEREEEAQEEPLAPTLDQYVALKIRVAKGERLTPREAAFLPWFEEACAGLLKDFGADVEMRVRLALVG